MSIRNKIEQKLSEKLQESLKVGSKVVYHDHKGNPTTGRITRHDTVKDVGEIKWDQGHRMANDHYIFRPSNGPAFVKHGDVHHIATRI